MTSIRAMGQMLMLLLVGVVNSPASAHDFWVQPSAYWMDPEAVTPMTLQVGHGPYRQRSPIPLARISRFQAIAPNGTTIELHDQLRLGQPEKDGDLRFSNSGVYVVVLETDNRAQSHLPAIRFNHYLKVEGLRPALDYREQTHQTDADGAENYSRCAKSFVQVGSSGPVAQTQVLKPVGLPLEIVPEKSPYAEPRSTSLPVRVLYEGRALAGALVKLTDLKHDEAPLEMQLTDATGHATFFMPQSGVWLLNVIWTKVLPRTRETDFETVFSSLSFGFTQQEQPL
jgi:uncharacterized GH25 family protein